MKKLINYDPTLKALIEQTDEDWGDPLSNRKNLIPYGIKPVDLALYGIDRSGELILIQGEEKNRKTTFWLNVLANIFTWKADSVKPVINIDTLETGMRPGKVRDALISIMATRYLIMHKGHSFGKRCQECGTEICSEIGISPKFLRYNSRTKQQLEAINYARDIMSTWTVLIHGASHVMGNTRLLQDSVKRWVQLIDQYGMSLLITDHIQQYNLLNTSDYEKQLAAIATVGDFSAQYSIPVLAVSQVSLGSLRESKTTGGKLVAAGGSKAAQEANTVFSISYSQQSSRITIKIEESRDAGSFSVFQKIDDVSGTFIGDATTQMEELT